MIAINDKMSPLIHCHVWTTAVVLTVVAVAATLASAGVGTAAALQQADNQEKAAKFNEAVAKNNTLAAQQQAKYEADRLRRRNAHLLGSQRAAFSKAGVDLSGSANDIINDTSIQGEMDALAALYTGKVRSNSERSSSMLFAMQADAATKTGYYNAAGSILGGVGGATSSASKIPEFQS